MPKFKTLSLFAAICLGMVSCKAGEPQSPASKVGSTPAFEFHFVADDDRTAQDLKAVIETGRVEVEAFFDAPFVDPVAVEIFPSREAFTNWFPVEWGMTETACWMVAAGVADSLAILSPRVWNAEACEHDAADAVHVRDIVIHELVHVYHGQSNPTRDFEGAESLGWFIEGLATYVSGQLDHGHRERALVAIAEGAEPKQLSEAWSGPYRYGVCGTLVEWIDRRCGRETLTLLLAATEQTELLELIGTTESELLAAWKVDVGGAID